MTEEKKMQYVMGFTEMLQNLTPTIAGATMYHVKLIAKIEEIWWDGYDTAMEKKVNAKKDKQ